MKLLRHTKSNKGEWRDVNQGDLGFTTQPQNGWIEKAVVNKDPVVLRLNLAKESITPKDTTPKAPTIGGAGAANPLLAGGMIAGGVPQMGTQSNEAFADQGDNMPF